MVNCPITYGCYEGGLLRKGVAASTHPGAGKLPQMKEPFLHLREFADRGASHRGAFNSELLKFNISELNAPL